MKNLNKNAKTFNIEINIYKILTCLNVLIGKISFNKVFRLTKVIEVQRKHMRLVKISKMLQNF